MKTQAERFEEATNPKGITLAELVRELFEILDTFEISNNGVEFHPTYISSVRLMHSAKLKKLLPKMKALANQ